MGVTTMQVTLRQWPGMKLSWLGAGAVLHSGDDPTPSAAQLVVSPHGSTECAVVIGSHNVKLQPEMVEELAEVLAHGLPAGFSTMRFVAWDGACALGDRPAAAHMLSMRLGIDVISAAGPLLGVPGGSLFAPVGRGAQRPGGWWRFRAGTMPVRVGWRFPAPLWEADLGELPELPGDLVIEHIPAGLWLHRRSVGSVTDLAYSVPTDHAHPSLILSHPSEEPLCREELGHGIGALPALTADKVVFTPYGQQPLSDGPVGPVVADMLGRAVHVRTGLPLCAAGGQEAVVTIDDKCLPRWRTFARELWHAPHGTPRAIDWTNPAPEVLTMPAGQAAFALGSGWVCEVIEAGIWIRPENIGDQADWIRAVPVDVNRCAIVVGAPHTPETDPPSHMITGLLERMPVDARKRAYLAVPRGAAPNVFVLATDMRDALPDPGEVELLSPATQNPSSPGAPSAHASLRVAPPGTFSSSFDIPSRPSRRDDRPAVARKPSPDFEQVNPQVPGMHPRRGPELGRRNDPARGGDFGATDLSGRRFDGPLDAGRTGAHHSGEQPRVAGQHSGEQPRVNGAHSGSGEQPRVNGAHSGEQPRVNGLHSGEQPRVNGAHHAPEPRVNGAHHHSGEQPRIDSRGELGTGAMRAVDPRGELNTGGIRPDLRAELATGGMRPGDPRGELPTGGIPRGEMPRGEMTRNEMTRGEMPTGAMRPVDPTGAMRPVDPRMNGDLPPGALRPGEMPTGTARMGEFPTGEMRAAELHRTGEFRRGMPVPNGNGHPGAGHNGNGHNGTGHPGAGHNGQVRGGMAYGSGPAPRVPEQTAFIDPQAIPPHAEDPQYRSQAMPVFEDRPVTDSSDDLMTTTGAQQRMSGKEVRSHRTGGKAPKRDDDKTNTQELDRLLGFFDAIRQAKAWDEDPTADESSDKRAVHTGRRH